MGPKGRYVDALFAKVNEVEMALVWLCVLTTRIYSTINAFLSGDFVSLVPSEYCQSTSKRQRIAPQTQRGMAVSQIRSLYPSLRLRG